MSTRFIALSLAILASCALAAEPLRIYTEIAPPWQTRAADWTAAGPAVEVVREIQKRVGNGDPIQIAAWDEGYSLVKSQPNVVLFLMTRTAERNDLFQWVGPLVEGSYGFYVKSDSKTTIKNMEAAKKLGKIGVYEGDARDQILTKAGFSNLSRLSQNNFNVELLMSGIIDAFAGSSVGVDALVKSAGYDPKDVKCAYTFYKYQAWIAFSKDSDAETVKAWARALQGMRKDKTLEKLMLAGVPTWKAPSSPITTF